MGPDGPNLYKTAFKSLWRCQNVGRNPAEHHNSPRNLSGATNTLRKKLYSANVGKESSQERNQKGSKEPRGPTKHHDNPDGHIPQTL